MNQHSASSRSAPLLSALDSLLGAISAYRNIHAIALMGLTFLAAIGVMAIFTLLAKAAGSPALAGLGGLLAAFVGLYGANAVGIMMMREAQGQEQCSIADAVLQSLFTTHRLIAVAILEGMIVLAAVVVVLLVLLLCKIPGLGPLLFAFAFPVGAVLLGMLVFALFYVMLPLAGPAVWSGSTVFQVLARLNVLARRRLLEVVSQQIILFFIVGFIASIIFAMIMIGFGMVTSLSAAILDFQNVGMMAFGGMMHGGGGSYVAAGAIGAGFLFAVAAVIPALIATKGVCLVYLNTTRGLDFAQAEAELESGVAAVKAKADQARERARQMAEKQTNSHAASAAPAASGVAAAAPADLACPSCHAPVAADDRFCGECGHKLQ
ncbi:zinc ribbon domain-containing protein [Janthinobacterium sp. 17J80-10]|uniref:zinc ribbon domain-containing protein n=1 Tax=Janthinobacterium sp. 17J80-10 TaxID=2497863 RepID=UPI001005632A|nr:zinc ribbon domain-containing protein [Janthinobacterium sp. 17J80-10]QAU33798.1 zinc ribbon domain-containing protein [Janthinobacterium sp. 17J80-10]